MSTLSVLPTTNSPSALASGTAQAASSAATLSADFDTFLQMLTAQAEYQDPLDPVSSSDYAAQLAQFSMVEQQVFTNDQLAALTDALGGSAISTLANWVGMEARAPAAVQFVGDPVSLSLEPAPSADRAQLVVYNDFGNEVGRLDIAPTSGPFEWNGLDQSGVPFGVGTYSFIVESYRGEDLIGSDPAQIYARVIEAQFVGDETFLKLEGGSSIPADQVTALREPGE